MSRNERGAVHVVDMIGGGACDGPRIAAGIKKPSHLLPAFAVGRGGLFDPDVQWFTLPVQPGVGGYGPYTPPPAFFAPYNTGTNTIPGDNPPFVPNVFPFHANVVRHWVNPPTFVVVIPTLVPALPNGAPNTGTLIGGPTGTFPGLLVTAGSPAAAYTWRTWSTAVQRTIGKYTGVVTANIAASFGGDVYTQRYGRSEGVGPAALSLFIWDSANGGPTGNGVNEIILTDQALGGLGLTSMLVDPNKGDILECDCIFEVGGTTANVGSGALRGLFQNPTTGPTTIPDDWTALDHEIGHFFGLDHTNLHSGVASPSAMGGAVLPVASYLPTTTVGGIGTTRTMYPASFTPTPTPFPPFPSMAGFITHMGAGVDMTQFALHNDDATSLSKIYPVVMPRKFNPKVPLINVSATIRGRYAQANGVGAFGRNVLAINSALLDLAGGYPPSGVISGTSRNSDDGIVPLSGPPLVPGVSVLGAGGTGDFSIEGIPAETAPNSGILGFPLNYDILMEQAALLNVQPCPFNQAEWFTTTNLAAFYAGNPLDIPTATPVPTAMTNVLNGIGTNIFPTTPLSVVQGTVIYLNPAETNDMNLLLGIIPGSQFVFQNPIILVGPRFREQAVRPLVSITPRLGRFTATNVVVTVRMSDAFYAYNLATATLYRTIGNAATTVVPIATFGPVNGIIGPGTTTWTIPMATILAGATTTTPVRLTFVISAAAPALDPHTGQPIVSAIGRNDVIL